MITLENFLTVLSLPAEAMLKNCLFAVAYSGIKEWVGRSGIFFFFFCRLVGLYKVNLTYIEK